MARLKQARPGGPSRRQSAAGGQLVGRGRRGATLADAATRRPGGVPKRRKRRKRPGTNTKIIVFFVILEYEN